ncbi:MAG: DUF3108 domain-containing protein [Sulfurimonas sp.]|nr:DUF3108 domain-containing protein [Sulfurimonas sp.]
MKFFLLTFILIGSVYAKDFSTRYDINVDMFGKVGYADITLKENGNTYEAKLIANTVDIAATLLGNRVETFTSKGKIVDGKYIPDIFIKTKTSTRKSRQQTYHFNHDKKEITLIEKKSKLVKSTKYNPIKFKIARKDIIKKSSKEIVLDTYRGDDILSSYLNTQARCNSDQKQYNLLAIGAYNNKNDVTLSYLDGLQKTSASSHFAKNTQNIYNLHVKPIDEDKSTVNILIAFDNDGIVKEAFLGEIFWIGKITAKRVYHKVSLK